MEVDDTEEEDIIVWRAQEGCQHSLNALYDMHKGLVYYHVHKERLSSPLSKDDVESLCNEMFMHCVANYTKGGFGKYFGTSIHYAIRDARLSERYRHLTVPIRVLREAHAELMGRTTNASEACKKGAATFLGTFVVEGGESRGKESTIERATEDVDVFLDGDAVRSMVEELPTLQRDIFRLLLLGYDVAEIGRRGRDGQYEGVLDVSRATVFNRYYAGLKKLQEMCNV